MGFHGSTQFPTPNIDSLAHTGIILNNYYVSPICSPSRSALMTARHPIHTGKCSGGGVAKFLSPKTLPPGEKLALQSKIDWWLVERGRGLENHLLVHF